jgi:uncharacterized membrane protein YeaQ/YmgE (transglycosylase-associated protein family)
VLGTILLVLVSGFVVGALARWAIPGPDPMPVWLTVAIGLAGSVVGGGIAASALHVRGDVSADDYFVIVLAEIFAACVFVIAYRRFVQKRPIVGPDAHKLPTRGFGIDRLRQRAGRGGRAGNKAEMLRRLDELHDRGALTDEEYVERRRKVLREE